MPATLSPEPLPTRASRGLWEFRTSPTGSRIRVQYDLPDAIKLIVEEHDRYLTFSAGRASSHGFPDGSNAAPVGRGVRIVDVATARPHFNNGQPLGVDAASFLAGFATNPRVGGEIGDVATTTLGGRPALTADLLPGGWTHLDTDPMVQVDLWPPSRLIVVDVDAAIVLVHIWAESDEVFDAWLRESRPLIESLRVKAVSEGVES